MKKYANRIALAFASLSSGVLLYSSWPILTDPSFDNIHWMILAMIVLVFVVYYKLLADILKEIL